MVQPEEGEKIKQQVTGPEITTAVALLSMVIFFSTQLFYLKDKEGKVPM